MKSLEQAGGGASLRPALLQARQAPRARARTPQGRRTTPAPDPDAAVLQDVPHDARREQGRPDLRVARVGRRESAVARARSRRPRTSSAGSSRSSRIPNSSTRPGPDERLLRTKLKLAAALRGQGADKLDEAANPRRSSRSCSPSTRVTSSRRSRRACCWKPRPQANQAEWSAAFAHWQELAGEARRGSGRGRSSYYDAWYHVAWRCSQQNETTEGPPDAQGRDAAESGRRQPGDEGEVRALLLA